jgi:hypothetical protein
VDADQWSRKIERELAEAVVRITHFPTHKEITKEIRDGDFMTLQEVSGQIQGMRADLREYVRTQVAEASLRYEKALGEAESRIMAAINVNRSSGNGLNGQNGMLMRWGPLLVAMFGLMLAIVSGNPNWLKVLA